MFKFKGTKTILIFFLLSLLLITMSACGGGREAEPEKPDVSAEPKDRFGGSLVVANALTPAHLDTDKTTDSNIGQMMFHVYEGLFEIDKSFKPTPHLAASYEVTNDGKTYEIKLREGVLFHNGKEMTSEDVVASFTRWLENNGAGKNINPYFSDITAPGKYEVVINLTAPYAPFLSFMSSVVANQKFTVKPKELVEQFGEDIMAEHIGTGPFKLVEFIPDQYLKMERFDDYSVHSGPAFAYSGEKIAYVDELTFMLIPEQAMRVAGVQTGEYHFADFAPRDQISLFEANPDIDTYIVSPYRQSFIIVNMGHAPLDNKYVRQALLKTLDMEELGTAMVGDEQFWFLNPSLFPPGHIWHVENGDKGAYNKPDHEKAKELLAQAGYDGTPIVILNSREDDIESRGAIAIKSQLEKVGFVVDVQLFDRATVVDQRSKVDGWNLHLSQFFSPDPDPQVYGAWMGTNKWIGNWDNEDSKKMDAIFEKMLSETDYTKRHAIVAEWHEYFYESVPYVKLFDFKQLRIAHKSLKGYENFAFHTFFNVWLED